MPKRKRASRFGSSRKVKVKDKPVEDKETVEQPANEAPKQRRLPHTHRPQ